METPLVLPVLSVPVFDAQRPVVDVQFALSGRALPYDYADALCQAVHAVLPWLEADVQAGIHPLSGLSEGEGGWYLSRRSRLSLRLFRDQMEAAVALVGTTLVIADHAVTVGASTVRELMQASVLYAKFVTLGLADVGLAEEAFLATCQQELALLEIAAGRAPRLLCGKRQRAATAAGVLDGFSLMVTGLDGQTSLRLQQRGLGSERKRGCGIFVPHKSVAAVGTLE